MLLLPTHGTAVEPVHVAFVHTVEPNPLAAAYDVPLRFDEPAAGHARALATGAVRGRPLRLRVEPFGPHDGRPYDTHLDELAGRLLAPPRPVAVVTDALPPYLDLAARLAPHGVVLVSPWAFAHDRATLGALGGRVLAPGWPALDRVAPAVAAALAGPGAGAIVFRGHPSVDAAADVLRAAAPHARLVELPLSRSQAEDNGVVARLVAGLRELRDAGVTQLGMLDAGGGGGALLAMVHAERLGWRPRWSVNSTMAPQGLVVAAPRAQLAGADGIGWSPLEDIPGTAIEATPARQAARAAFSAAGVGDYGSRYEANVPLYAADAFGVLRAALELAPATDHSGLATAAAALGTTYASPLVGATRFGDGRFDGPRTWRRLRHAGRAFAYEGPARPLP